MADSWASLPHIVLVQILEYLEMADRANSALVCTTWFAAYTDPSVWKNVVHRVDTQPRQFQVVVSRFGKHFKRLALVWDNYLNCSTNHHQNSLNVPLYSRNSDAPYVNILALVANRIQVKCLVLTDWAKSCKCPNRSKLMLVLSKFMRMQEKLAMLSLGNACMRQSEVFHLAGAALNRSAAILRALDLRSAFRERQDPYAHPRYLSLISSLTGLRHLALDYHAISDPILQALGQSTPQLIYLKVVVRPCDARHPPIQNSSWAEIKSALKYLNVHIELCNFTSHDEVIYFLKPSMPLHTLHLNSGKAWDPCQVRHFSKTLLHIITCYSSSLEGISIRLRHSSEYIDELIIDVISNCQNLRKFHYDGTLKSLDTISNMMQRIERLGPNRKETRIDFVK